MHTTASEAMRLTCVYAGPFAASKKKKMNTQKTNNDFLSNKYKYLVGCIICFFLGYYGNTRDWEIDENQLTNIEITLKEKPEYTAGDFRNYTFISNEYQRKFQVINFALDVIDKEKINKEIKKGDKLIFLVKKDDARNLNNETIFNNYNRIYGIQKNDVQYINLDERNIYQKEDKTHLLILYILGFVSLIYFFIDRKIPIKYSTMMCIIGIICFILISILNYFNILIKQ